MEENTQHFWHMMLYYFKKGKDTTEKQKKICAVYGEGAATDPKCQKWFVKFLGTRDILAKQFFAVGLSYVGVFSSTPGLYPLKANSGR